MMSEPGDIENARDILHQKEKEWKLKMWHDHLDILNHSYVSFMSCFLYDPINFLTDEEFNQRNPEKKKKLTCSHSLKDPNSTF